VIPDTIRAARRTAADLDASGRHADAAAVRALCEAHLTLLSSLTVVVQAAVREELEACIEACDSHAEGDGALACADTLRARRAR